jgi:hypothetical protein
VGDRASLSVGKMFFDQKMLDHTSAGAKKKMKIQFSAFDLTMKGEN